MKLDEHMPVDHRLARVYRIGAVLVGAFLVAFGILGFLDWPGFTSTTGVTVLGLSTNGALSLASVVVGTLLVLVGLTAPALAAWVNSVLGVLFIVNGMIGLALLRTSVNFFAFTVRDVIFSYVVGLVLMVFGFYGRVSGGLPPDNPYYRARHGLESMAERAERLERQEREKLGGHGDGDGGSGEDREREHSPGDGGRRDSGLTP